MADVYLHRPAGLADFRRGNSPLMLGLGIIGTIIVVVLIVWLVTRVL
jgi:hypothetical protein